jgi:hypothetical protein
MLLNQLIYRRVPEIGLLLCQFLSVMFLSVGCGSTSPADAVAAMNDSSIRKVANLYMAFQLRNGMRGPKDEAEFKAFIQNDMPRNKLDMMQVNPDAVDELFISEKDGQPFEVNYGLSGSAMSVMAVVFEQQGVNGMKRVGFTNGPVKEVNDEQYQQLKKNPMEKIETSPTAPAAVE